MAQFAQGFRFDLANALARDVELFADFFERVIGVEVDAEAHTQHFCFARCQLCEHCVRGLAQRLGGRLIDRRGDRGVFDEIAEV